MTKTTPRSGSDGNEEFQDEILPGVSRTFALTIPQLPLPLRRTVTNAYLLCRIADTIEDDPGVPPADKEAFHRRYVDALNGRADARAFARDLAARLTDATSPQEKRLVRCTERIVDVTRGLEPGIRSILSDRIAVMCRGMPVFQRNPRSDGLRNLADLDEYCYYVAGVVGEMLTELFCDYSRDITRRRNELFSLSTSFGQGLQMTNILKDIWEDRERGTCWLPRDVFAAHGYDLADLNPHHRHHGFNSGLKDLVAVAHGHLRNALSYTTLIPPGERGIRRFCLWSGLLAVLTLRRIHHNPGFTTASQVKVSRRTVRGTMWMTGAACGNNLLVRALFACAARGLTLARDVTTHREYNRPLFRAQ